MKYLNIYVIYCCISNFIVESLGSGIDVVIGRKRIAVKESENPVVADYTENVVLIKFVGPAPSAQSNQKLF